MAEVVLFHHVMGLTDGVRALAERWRDAGHEVHAPDLFEGRVFPTIEDGFAYVQSVGFGTVIGRAADAVETLPSGLVYAGISMGVLGAQNLAQNRAGARGAVLLEACVPPSEFGSAWPADVPVQVHGMDHDPFFAEEGDIDAARELVASASDGALFTYPGDVHLFVDSSTGGYDAAQTDRVVERVLAFLDRV
ncbi:dienelactone hydrolase family protein [Actinotalea sp. M2MS4P-6]|uniref:dienelactone hydrolase family protein n=1 Tax=Actinotalea sp. M2MS4P-6 TaxID=2983762 RepID=UPI0021E44A5E|nr:dienelactone hydrolase family protein [Actinotalea sp. M2MS4P-6]MCV2393108.1 dienelactone hydrolase family protein [Actinotalea sp. M2MS4P-6]